jgi:Cu+-exporting ATPase
MMASAGEALAARLSALYQHLRGRRLADLAVDPICHMWVDPGTATVRRYDGADYYFCSSRCVKRFDSDPGRFLAPASR